MHNMSIEEVANYFIQTIAVRPVYPEDPTQRWYRVCNEVHQLTQGGWGTNELANRFYEVYTEFPNIAAHAYYTYDLIGKAQPSIIGFTHDQNVNQYHQQEEQQAQEAYEQQQNEPILPQITGYIDVPWEDTAQPLIGNDPYADFQVVEQPVDMQYGAPATPIESLLEVGPPAQVQGEELPPLPPTPPLNNEQPFQSGEAEIILPGDLEKQPDVVEMTKENPWGTPATLHLMTQFHEIKEGLGLDNETIIPHIRHYLKKEEATMEDITPDNIGAFNEYLKTIQK